MNRTKSNILFSNLFLVDSLLTGVFYLKSRPIAVRLRFCKKNNITYGYIRFCLAGVLLLYSWCVCLSIMRIEYLYELSGSDSDMFRRDLVDFFIRSSDKSAPGEMISPPEQTP